MSYYYINYERTQAQHCKQDIRNNIAVHHMSTKHKI